jgi:hypothetical protein
MRFKQALVVGGVAAVAGGAGAAIASHPIVPPATVPTGFFAAHDRINDVPLDQLARAFKSGKTDGFLEHVRLGANQASGFHTHPGPAFILVAGGTLNYQQASRGRCVRRRFGISRGFFERGVHQVVAGPAGADYYEVYLLPRLTGPHFHAAARPSAC